jgi:hypothetical protein
MTVTDHAILRYLERIEGFGRDWLFETAASALGRTVYCEGQAVAALHQGGWIDREAVAAAILTRAVRAACWMGDGIVHTDRIAVVVKNGAVVTIMTRAMSAANDRSNISHKPPQRREVYRRGNKYPVPA